jgi:hypothetical protein
MDRPAGEEADKEAGHGRNWYAEIGNATRTIIAVSAVA